MAAYTIVSSINLKYFVLLCCSGTVYVYMSEGAGASKGQGAFRALSRGFQHWSSGRIERIDVNLRHPHYCHVRCSIKPSMKQGVYHVYLLLQRDGEHGRVLTATCECAAGYVFCMRMYM